ncbi:MAG: hypothetical protein JJE39_14025 [Vicinamibacteria bacterium]|nr:hypothetical protein [Vicinamibacteria bacterium]
MVEVDGHKVDIYVNQVSASFLDTMKIPILRGRSLIRGDQGAVVVSESLARKVWPDEEPLGKPFSIGTVDEDGDPASFTVIGIAGSARTLALRDPDTVELYRLASEADLTWIKVMVRTSGSPKALAVSVARAAMGIDPNVIPQVQLLKTSFRQRTQDLERSALAVMCWAPPPCSSPASASWVWWRTRCPSRRRRSESASPLARSPSTSWEACCVSSR